MNQPGDAEVRLPSPEHASLEPLKPAPVEWARTHLRVIKQTMEDVRQEQAKQWPSKLIEFSGGIIADDSLLTKYRRLSEMKGLCVALDDLKDLSEGFSVVDGSAKTTDSNRWEYHTFLQRIEPDGGKTFFGVSEAQFMQPPTSAQALDEEGRFTVVMLPAHPGQKMSMLLERAEISGRPDLYTRLNRQVAVMYGREDEIRNCLGLEFSSEKPSVLNFK